MAETPEAVAAFYDSLVPRLEAVRDRELAVLTDRFHAEGHTAAGGLGLGLLRRAAARSEFGVDANLVAEYLPMEACLEGLFALTGDVFGLEYRPVADPAWHPSVEMYEIVDRGSGELIASFYADWFPREGSSVTRPPSRWSWVIAAETGATSGR